MVVDCVGSGPWLQSKFFYSYTSFIFYPMVSSALLTMLLWKIRPSVVHVHVYVGVNG